MNAIKKLEAMFIDTVAAVTPWLAPLIPAYLVYHNMTQRLGYPPIFGLIGAAAVEFLGLSAVHTAVTFWQWNDAHKIERAPFWFAFGAGLFYVVIVLTVNAALDIWRGNEGVKILAHGLLSLLSVDAAVIIAIRAPGRHEGFSCRCLSRRCRVILARCRVTSRRLAFLAGFVAFVQSA